MVFLISLILTALLIASSRNFLKKHAAVCYVLAAAISCRRRCLHGHRRICRVPSVGAQLDLANFCKKRPVHRPVRGGHVCGCRSQRLQN